MPVNLNSIDALEGALTYHRDRHTVLAGNVANLDTPGFRSSDLTRTIPTEPGQMAVTDRGHISTGSPSQITTSFDDSGVFQTPDGNAVSLERELAKIDANRTRYSTAAELVSRRMAMLRYAAGDGT